MESSKTSKKRVKQAPAEQNRGPVIVYVTSPEIIEVKPEEFKGVVQQLTGNQSSNK